MDTSKLLSLLEAHRWKTNVQRANITGVDEERQKRWKRGKAGKACLSYTFGLVNKRCFKEPSTSSISTKQPEIYEALKDLAKQIDPDFKYTSICVNKNVQALPHIDKNNEGHSMIVGLGNYTGGELVVEYPEGDKVLNCKDTPCYFDGRVQHYTKPFGGGTGIL